jgi:uncharacterized repeat protein (TIGR03843 family)
LLSASNASFLGEATLDGVSLKCIYKPVKGERPLWDFPDGTLAGRERAARLVSEAGGWGIVPPTVLRDGSLGTGMCLRWIEVGPDVELVDVVPTEFDESGWIAILEAEDHLGQPVLLVHRDDDRLRQMSVLDVVLNNADRKGGHVLVGRDGRVFGCDHGVSFHAETKLRTVLWGWADEPLRQVDLEMLDVLGAAFDSGLDQELEPLITGAEIAALHLRIDLLRALSVMPSPEGRWPAIPWPAF